ncbi:MAG: phosphopantetheinyltransferase component of enterobactin synthase multienzyme complex [Ilumatobacteraceae bacterium]|nr:phosphopantetheinyltransferase component of enterobactin synthase multienzyme complex [Ilumatobacteraceae bacterium]
MTGRAEQPRGADGLAQRGATLAAHPAHARRAARPRGVPSAGMIDEVGRREIDRALASLALPGVVTGARLIDGRDLARLFPVEAASVGRAVDRRRHEFATGRALLRELLRRDVAMPVRPDRAPQLPPGVVGSLAHDADVAVAALSIDARFTALGIDVEPATSLSAEIAAVVLRADEAGLDAHLAFTLKEAVYKAWSSGGGTLIDHHAVRLTVEGDRFSGEVLAAGARFHGRYAGAAGRWLALVVVSRS